MATFMIASSAPNACMSPAKIEKSTIVLAEMVPSMPNTPVKLVVE